MDGGLDQASAYDFDLDLCKRLFRESRDRTQRAREAAKRNRAYYDGKQISETDRKALQRRRQPIVVDNMIKKAVQGLVGVVERGKTDPKAFPRNPGVEQAAEVATDVLRAVNDETRFDRLKIAAFENEAIEGTCAAIVEVDEKLNVKIRRGRFEEFFYDPHSRELDFSDASYMGFAKWQYVQEVQAAYPEMKAELETQCSLGLVGDSTWNDRPYESSMMWTDRARKRLIVVEMYRIDGGVWRKCVFTEALKLEGGDSPYLDDEGRPMNPIEAQSAFIDDDNNRYGPVSDWISLQDSINKRKSKMLYLASVRQIQQNAPDAAEVDADEARTEAARPDGVIPAGWQIVPTSDVFAANAQLLQLDMAAMDRAGVNPAILGRQGEGQSGRANLVRQQAGLTELASLYSGIEDFDYRIQKQIWARVRQFWSEPKFIRVTDDENAFRFVHINKPVTEIRDEVVGYDPMSGEPIYQPVEVMVGMENAIAEMDVDIIVESVPDTANVQQEQFQALVDLARAGVPIPPDMLLEASSLPKKRQIMDKMKQASQQPNPAQELALRGAAAKVAKDEADVGKTRAETQETMAETAIKAQQAANPMLEGWLNAG